MAPREGPAASDESLKDKALVEQTRELVIEDPSSLEGFRPMRVAMVQTAYGLKPPSGGFRGNYATLFALAKHGHETMQFCWATLNEISAAYAELKAVGKGKESGFDTGTTTMLNDKLEDVEVTWWTIVNAHGVLCIALDQAVMQKLYPNHIQQVDAATWIEVRGATFALLSLTSTNIYRPVTDQLGPNHTRSGLHII